MFLTFCDSSLSIGLGIYGVKNFYIFFYSTHYEVLFRSMQTGTTIDIIYYVVDIFVSS